MLFIRLSWPANVPPPPYCGVRREMSLMRPDTVGSEASSSRRTAVAAPVRDELNTTSDLPTTVTVSLTADSFSENAMSVLTPRLTTRPSWTSVLNPVEHGRRFVRSADPHVLDEEPAVTLRDGLIRGAGGDVHHRDADTRDNGPLRVASQRRPSILS